MNDEVRITWIDTKMYGCSWLDEVSLSKYPPARCRTVGILVDETDKEILIVQSETEDDNSNLIVIPKGCIKKIKRLR